MDRQQPSRDRAAFTLIELIVVITLILFLAGMLVAFMPTATTQQREANAGGAVQGWLTVARQRALRDQAPRGLRLWNKNQNLRISECQYIEQPDLFSAEAVTT